MKRLFAALGIALLLASCASNGRPSDRQRFIKAAGKPVANPSDIVKAELAFARLAREEGQWTAFRETAAPDAIMFTPEIVNAQVWLKGKADPPRATEWQAHKIFMSCDGSMGVATGAWQGASGGTGYFTTIWEKQNAEDRRLRGKDVEWKWIFDHGVPLDKPLEEPDFVTTRVASCSTDSISDVGAVEAGEKNKNGTSADGTIFWSAESSADKSRSLVVRLWNGSEWEDIVNDDVQGSTE
ncbi:hypothetical protein GCM10009096_00390 [Parasphingorhabdus litoris]|uniref:DUF1579 domain-containing protein n=1 Tax=Parasphingorhabdus litoris TaxID=394733 RepID=A0ABN0ZZG2_9SPHN|nr:hypothetical protein [Parasphingorhabdus litoris]